jgi:hypothetical protein
MGTLPLAIYGLMDGLIHILRKSRKSELASNAKPKTIKRTQQFKTFHQQSISIYFFQTKNMVCRILNVYKCVNRRPADDYWEGLNDGMDSYDDDSVPLFYSDKKEAPAIKHFSRPISTRRLKRLFGMFHFSLPKRNSFGYHRHRRSNDHDHEESETDEDEFLIWRPFLVDEGLPDLFDEEASVQFSLDDLRMTYSV